MAVCGKGSGQTANLEHARSNGSPLPVDKDLDFADLVWDVAKRIDGKRGVISI
jgi:hypothetical protein